MRDYLGTTGFEPILEHGENNGMQGMDESMNFDDMEKLH